MRSQRKSGLARSWSPYVFAFPGLVLILMFIYYPIAKSLQYSFYKWDIFSGTSEWIGLENYVKLLASDEFGKAFLNNVAYILVSLACQIAISLILAAFLERMAKRKLSVILRTTFFMPSLISLTVIGLLFTFVYKTDGVLNELLRLVGLGHWASGWLGNPKTAMGAIIAVSQWRSIGYTMMLFIVAIQRIPSDIHEAARMDGANSIQSFFLITLPLIKDMIKVCILITIAGGLLIFNEVFIMTNGGPFGRTEVLSTLMYKNAFVHGKVGYASAIANIILALSFTFAVLQNLPSREERRDRKAVRR